MQAFANPLQKGRKGVFFIKLRYLCAFRLLVKRPIFCTDIEEEQELNRKHLIVFFVILSRFLRNKRDILLSFQRDYKAVMNIAKGIRRGIAEFSGDYVFTAETITFATFPMNFII